MTMMRSEKKIKTMKKEVGDGERDDNDEEWDGQVGATNEQVDTWQKQVALLIYSQSNRRVTCFCHVINLFICRSNLFIPLFFIVSFPISHFFS